MKRGWHDVVLEAYLDRFNMGTVKLDYEKESQAVQIPLGNTRPFVSPLSGRAIAELVSPRFLIRNGVLSIPLPVSDNQLENRSPRARVADLWFAIKPARWDGLRIYLRAPESQQRIPVAFEGNDLQDNAESESNIYATIQLPDVAVFGEWTVEIYHPDVEVSPENYLRLATLGIRYQLSQELIRDENVAVQGEYRKLIDLRDNISIVGASADTVNASGANIDFSIRPCATSFLDSCGDAASPEAIPREGLQARYVLLTAKFDNPLHLRPVLAGFDLTYETVQPCSR
jgi:hypothetical protein